jgi:hypothetical protein
MKLPYKRTTIYIVHLRACRYAPQTYQYAKRCEQQLKNHGFNNRQMIQNTAFKGFNIYPFIVSVYAPQLC